MVREGSCLISDPNTKQQQSKVLTWTLPDITAIMALAPDLAEIARDRLRVASDIIREQAESYGALCLDVWSMPAAIERKANSSEGT
jgi:hypothetical protein